MASLQNFLKKQFLKCTRKLLEMSSPKRRRTSSKLSVESLEDRVVFSVNPIIAENQLPGTPESVWDVPGAGDPTIQGYAAEISVDVGQTVNFKINDVDLAPYNINIYRVGYYQGDGARLITTIPSSQTLAVDQPAPLFNPSTALVDAGNWSVTASWAVPSTAVSGVYFADVHRTDTGGEFMILFVVRDDASHSQILYQINDETWQAYNTWGGYSLYQYTNGVPGPGYEGAAYQVSYNRPLIIRGTVGSYGDITSFFYDEFPAIEYLEENGYNVTYFTGLDADQRGNLILNHQIYMDSGHDEYWSGNQEANVIAARNAGVNLAFFSGNTSFWKTYFGPSIDSTADPDRTLNCYKETHQDAITDQVNPGIWTGSWMDPTFDSVTDPHEPQNSMTGTLFVVNDGPSPVGTPFTVPYGDSLDRIWRNTSVAQLQPGQTATLGDYELGFEWDEDVDNGYRPAGEIDVSSTTEEVPQLLVDEGNTYDPGTATNSLTEYRAASGALVFSAGMVQFDWALSGYHDGYTTGTYGFNSRPVLAVQQMAVNLFADMGVQPGTLMTGLVAATESTDTTLPRSAITSPMSGTSLKTGVPVTISGTAQAFGGVVAGIEVSTDGGQTWHPATGTTNWSYTWVPSAPGTVTILSRATDDSLNTEVPSDGVTVTVAFQSTSTAGLVAAYSFNQNSGTTLTDSSGNNNKGTIANGTWVSGGLFGGNALSFNGQNTWVTVPNSTSLNLTSEMTLEAWVKPTTFTSSSVVAMKESTDGLSYAIYAANNAQDGAPTPADALIDVNGSWTQAGNTNDNDLLPTGTWSFLTATYNGTDLDFYINGNLVSSMGVEGSIDTSTGVLRIGGDSIWGEYFDGLMDDMRIYNVALNQAEIFSDMSTPIGGTLVKTTAPTDAITGLSNGSTVSGNTTLTATASDAVVVTSVQFLLNGTPLGAPVVAAPYSLSWNSQTAPNGTYTLSVVAINGVGLSTTSAPVTIVVDNPSDTVPPTVQLTETSTVSDVSGVAVLSAVASDPVGVTSVQFQLNGADIGPLLTTAPYRVAFDFSSITSGNYNLTAVATDAAGNQTSSSPVTVTVDHTPPTVVSTSIVDGAVGVATDSDISVTFDKSVQPVSIVATLQDSSGNGVPLTVTYDDTTDTATFSPGTIALNPLTTYTLTLTAADLDGNALASPFSTSFTTSAAIIGATIWDATATPSIPSASDTSSNELGLKFESDVFGDVTGVRFYKGTLNTGTHVGHLWSDSGSLLGSVTFTNETASGWQQANFATPISISANTVYIVSYSAPNGGYSYDADYFASSGVSSGPLEALAAGASGDNGVFSSTGAGGFPNSSYEDANYWVDVVFSSTTASTTPPTVTAETPPPGSSTVSTTTTLSVTFSKTIQASTINFTVQNAAGNVVPGSVTYDSATSIATFTPTAPLAVSTTYTATVSGATDLSGNVLSMPFSWSFTTTNPSAPPSVTTVTPTPGSADVSKNTTLSASFSKDINDDVLSFVLTDSAGNVIPGVVTYDDEYGIATFTPSGALNPGTTYTARLSNVVDLLGNVMPAPYSWSFTVALSTTTESFWNETATPSVPSAADSNAQELGMKFIPDVSGSVDGVMFYKGASNTGTHIGHLWDAEGDLLGSVTFTNETASGWQEALFANPISVTAGLTYVVSYYAPAGGYAYTSGYFTSPVTVGDLTAPGGTNGVFVDGAGGGFPNSSYGSANYWVDVLFSATTYSTPPTVAAESPASGATGVLSSSAVTATFSQDVQPETITFTLTDQNGNNVPGTVSYNPSTQIATFTPTSALAASMTYTAAISGVENTSGMSMTGSTSWSFATSVGTSSYTLWGSSVSPAVDSAVDPNPNDLGMKFYADSSGLITGAEFYKGTANTGTHVGQLWDASGDLLASATFTNETASGWQTVSFPTPVSIQAGTEYIISYYAPNGGYAYSSGYFASTGVDVGPLHAYSNAIAGGQGVYEYGTGGDFPTDTYNATNYWVQPIFTVVDNATPPSVTAESPASTAIGVSATGVSTTAVLSVTFSEAVISGSIEFTVTGPNNTTVPGTVSYNPATQTASFTPTSALASSTIYTVTVSGAQNTSGVSMTGSTSWSFTTSLGTSSYTFWGSSVTPAVASVNDPSPDELGMKFYSDSSGFITGAEFYKGPENTGTQVAHLWDGEGDLLATATFTNETATGWQTVNFPTPVSIQAGTTYIISYYAPNGGYAYTSAYFATAGVDAGPLHAYSNGAGGGQGVYAFGTGSGFPTQSYNATNYWVQPIFTVPNNFTPPTVTGEFPASGSNLVLTGTEINATFSEPVQGTTVNFVVESSNGTVVNGTVSYNPTTQMATFSPTTPLSTLTTYTVTVSAAENLSGVAMSTAASWSFTTLSSTSQLTITNFSGGTFEGTEINQSGDLQLTGEFQDDFSGTQLNSQAWETTTWQANSAVTVSNSLSLQGAELLSAQTVTTSPVEGSISFGANPYQYFGMATGLSTVGGSYWAMFGTEGSTNTLFATVNASGTTQSVNLGALPTGFHDYKVQPTASGFNFYVDGTLATSIAVTFPTGTQLSIVLSSYNDATTPALQAQSMQVDNYASSGTYTSSVINVGQSVDWTQVNFNAVIPTGTTLTINVMIGTLQTNGTISWMTVTAVQNGQELVTQNGDAITGQYLQFTVTMTTTDPSQTPELNDISFSYANS